MGCCKVLCHLPSVLTQVHVHVIHITSGVTLFVHFYAKTFAFVFRDVLFENYPSLELHSDFVYCQMFRRVAKFLRICLTFSIVCRGCHLSCQLRSCYCP
jgi:hypothetical protein